MCDPGAWQNVKKKELGSCLRRPCQCVNAWVLEMQRQRQANTPVPYATPPETLEEKR